ncbi:33224_t:CDS:2 [Gigaspora margarita]|uniref:33224_t:CDS:1 n=1 Tax=Gigaspora margarita TaxID=4874 RepID=A0ABN7VJN1_GIGMA|nr:33224_t:CDS:2 [Gigaspora margarita]
MVEVVEVKVDHIKYSNKEYTSFLTKVVKEINIDYNEYINETEDANLLISFYKTATLSMFVEFNQYQHNILFAQALLLDESTESYTWMFEEILKATKKTTIKYAEKGNESFENSSEVSSENSSKESSKDEVNSDKENQELILLNPKKRYEKGQPQGTKHLKLAYEQKSTERKQTSHCKNVVILVITKKAKSHNLRVIVLYMLYVQ